MIQDSYSLIGYVAVEGLTTAMLSDLKEVHGDGKIEFNKIFVRFIFLLLSKLRPA